MTGQWQTHTHPHTNSLNRTGHNNILKNSYKFTQHSFCTWHLAFFLNIQQQTPTYIQWEYSVLLRKQTKENLLSAGSRFDTLLPSDTDQSVVAAGLQHGDKDERFGGLCRGATDATSHMTDACGVVRSPKDGWGCHFPLSNQRLYGCLCLNSDPSHCLEVLGMKPHLFWEFTLPTHIYTKNTQLNNRGAAAPLITCFAFTRTAEDKGQAHYGRSVWSHCFISYWW